MMGARVERVRTWLELSARLMDAQDALGQRARQLLPETTGLSAAGVEFALQHCSERCPSPAALAELCRRTPKAPRAHVLLSANVFTAPVRAIALALAASDRVYVRASRREPVLPRLLSEAAPDLFELVDVLTPEAGDHVWAYGEDATLAAFGEQLPEGVVIHAHGFGYSVAVLDESVGFADDETLPRLARALALDSAVFDQRGCLSPRLVLVQAPAQRALELGQALVSALGELQQSLPRGRLTDAESTASHRFVDSLLRVADFCEAGDFGAVALLQRPTRWLLPPAGRHLLLLGDVEACRMLEPLQGQITQLGLECSRHLEAALAQVVPRARVARWGAMQRPPLDGPVDRRTLPRVVTAPG